MADSPMPMDELEDYLFGRLTPAACHRFEARLTQDAALQRHVRELEEGALALAMAAPQLRPPREAWTKIQAGIACERQHGFPLPVFQVHRLLRGWSLAGGLAVAVFIYIAAVHVGTLGQHVARAGTSGKQTNKSETIAFSEGTQFAGHENSNAIKSVATANNAAAGTVASVQTEKYTHAEGQVSPEIDATTVRETKNTNAIRQSARTQYTRLRQAVMQAMTHSMEPTNSQAQSLAGALAQIQVDYVEFPNPIGVAVTGPGVTATGTTPFSFGTGLDWSVLSPGTPSPGSDAAVSAFPSDNDLVVTIDPAMLPANIGSVTIWVEDVGGSPIVVGTVNPGSNPMIIDVQNAGLGSGYLYTVTAGGTNILGHFP